jgi:sulfonate transport system permease protein
MPIVSDTGPSPSESTSRRAQAIRAAAISSAGTWGLRIAVVACCIGLWQLFVTLGVLDPFFVSTPSRVAARLWTFTQSGTLASNAWPTLREALEGFALGVIGGTAIGFVLGQSRLLASTFLPLLNLANTLPRVALAPLFVLWFGIGEQSKLMLVFTIVVVILVFNTYAGTQTVDPELLTNARLLGAKRRHLVLRITLPWTIPWIFSGMRIALAWSLGGAVIGEYIASQRGLGFLLFSYAEVLDQTGLLAICVVLLLLSGALFAILSVVERRVLRWRPERR